MKDNVNHPSHYQGLKEKCGIEVIDITRHFDFNTWNALKYILRAGLKEEEWMTLDEKKIEDYRKAVWYLQDEIANVLTKPKEECIVWEKKDCWTCLFFDECTKTK